MSDPHATARFLRDRVFEPDHISRARTHALELGAQPISAATGAQCAVVAAAGNAKSIIELGTGAGVSALWLLHGSPTAVLTTIDVEPEYLAAAKSAVAPLGLQPGRVRFITGRAAEVLPRMNEAAYDIVLIDADPARVVEYAEHARRLARAGGVILVPRVLHGGRVADPVARDDVTTAYRALVDDALASSDIAALSTVDDGLLQIVVGPDESA